MSAIEYKKFLVDGILEFQTEQIFTRKQLEKMSIRALEIIFDNVQ